MLVNEDWFALFNLKEKSLAVIDTHYATSGASTIMPIDSTDLTIDVPQAILLPLKWEAELLDLHPTPYKFVQFIQQMIT